MKSGKQRRFEIKAHRLERAKKRMKAARDARFGPAGPERIPVDFSQLAPTNSYGVPEFYEDIAFACRDCGKEEVWTAKQQRWWYEVAKGNVDSTAVRCRACRKVERARKAEARRLHLEGLAHKNALADHDEAGFAATPHDSSMDLNAGQLERDR